MKKITTYDLDQIQDASRYIWKTDTVPKNIDSIQYVTLCYLKSISNYLKLDLNFSEFEFPERVRDDD